MIKLTFTIFLGVSSILLFIYTYCRNQPRLSGKIISWILIPTHQSLSKNTLLLYPIIVNNSIQSNTPLAYDIFLKINTQFIQIPQFYGIEDSTNSNYFIVSGPQGKTLFIPEIKQRLLYKNDNPIKSNHKIHGYLACALDTSINIEDITDIKIKFKDAFNNKFEINYSMSSKEELLLYLQLSNAKVYNKGEEKYLNEAIQRQSK
jgi:hypothetical protein